MEINKEMKIWAEKTTVCIRVNPHYTFYAKVNRIGNFSDSPDVPSMWGWIHHLKEKVWWNIELQRSFIDLCSAMENDNKIS